MTPSILLLDCSSRLLEKLKNQGFDVNSGTMGFCNQIRQLPCQAYEKEILIYNPSLFARDSQGYIAIGKIKNLTPEYNLNHLKDHLLRGATFLIFLNRVANNPTKQNEAYNWIPFMPAIIFTKDQKSPAVNIKGHYKYDYLAPVIVEQDLKFPVEQKIFFDERTYKDWGDFTPLFFNKNHEALGIFFEIGRGRLLILPEYKSNEKVISDFLHRVVPKIFDFKTKISLIDEFLSLEEIKENKKIERFESGIKDFSEKLEITREVLGKAKRNKIQTIEKDKTATSILNYYDLALRQEDVSLFYLYKITEILQKKYGNEKEAKKIVACNTEWNLIRKDANVSYGDIRHAPDPGEKIKEWTPEEIKKCFNAAKKIIKAYLSTLF